MAINMLAHLLLVLVACHHANAGDPDITSDFVLPPNTNAVDGSFFTHTGFSGVLSSEEAPAAFKATKASMAEFPALNGQSVSYAVLQFPAGSVNPPLTHPRAAELLLVVDGSLEVGLVDTTNKLYTQTLQTADMFFFPKGLAHYQYNLDPKNPAMAISSFGSANAGTVSIPGTLFNTTVDEGILTKSFKTDLTTIQKIKAGFAAKA